MGTAAYRHCPHCGSEYQPWVERCFDCDVPLGAPVSSDVPPPAIEEKDESERGTTSVEIVDLSDLQRERLRMLLQGMDIRFEMTADELWFRVGDTGEVGDGQGGGRRFRFGVLARVHVVSGTPVPRRPRRGRAVLRAAGRDGRRRDGRGIQQGRRAGVRRGARQRHRPRGVAVEVLSYERVGATQQAGTGSLRVESIQVVGNGPLDGGTERAVIVFNEPLPVIEAQYVPDIVSADPTSGLAYTTQGPDSTHVCDSVHSVPQGAVGSVDLLVPAAWFAPGTEAHTGPGLETIDNPAKFPVCGPHNGFIQYAMWSPLSADPADVTVTISPDRTTITIETASGAETGLDPHAGQDVVAEFLDHLRAGDLEAAAEKWTGYPELGPDSTPADRVPHVEDLAADPTFARIMESDTTTTFVVPSTDEGGQVVTVLDAREGENPPAAIAFLTGWSDEQGSPGTMWIQRLPLDSPTTDTVDLPAGSYVQRGQDVVVPGVPLEGGARAFIDDQEVPVDVDHDNVVMRITIPDDAEGDVAVTVVTSSPELAGVRAFAVTVR